MGDLRKKKFEIDGVCHSAERSHSSNKIKSGNLSETVEAAHSASSILFFHGRRSDKFFTEDSRRYITPREQQLIDLGFNIDHSVGNWDCLSSRVIRDYRAYNSEGALYRMLIKRYSLAKQEMKIRSKLFVGQFSLVKVWNFSLVGAILLGMISMTFIYRYLGQGAMADELKSAASSGKSGATVEYLQGVSKKTPDDVLKTETDAFDQKDLDYISSIAQDLESSKKNEFEDKLRSLVKGYPIEEMLPYIAEKDKLVAAFMVSIAKKESNWGKRVPVLNGQDCYNYWGYRGQRKLMGTGGHTCFNSRKDAVDTVAKRIDYLVNEKKLNTPEKLVIWKCGSSCAATGGQAAANKWISDVKMYLEKARADEES